MGMTKAQFDDFSVAMDTAYDDLLTAQDARDALSGGVESAQAAMEAAVGDVDAKARALDILAQQFKNAYRDEQDVTPYVAVAGPLDESEDVAVDAPISVTFSKVMDEATINTTNLYVLDGVTHVPATVSLDASGKIATITPDDPLDAETLYKIHVTVDATDVDGDGLSNVFEQENGWTTAAA